MVYQWKNGSFIKSDANLAGRMCEQLEATGDLSAKALLDANRPEDAPLHNEFEWDDSVAAEQYRLSQARHIINCLVVSEEKQEPTRAFFNIQRSEGQYHSLDLIMRNEDTREALLETALRELSAFQHKYSQLKELANVFASIDEIRSKRSA